MGNEESRPGKQSEPECLEQTPSAVLWDPLLRHEELQGHTDGVFRGSSREDYGSEASLRQNSCSGVYRGGSRQQEIISEFQGVTSVCGESDGDDGVGILASIPEPKLIAMCHEYFDRFDRNRDERLSLDETRALVGAVCGIWQVAIPDTVVLGATFERHRHYRGNGLSRETFVTFARELLEFMFSRHRGLAVPSAAAALAVHGRAAGRTLLHAPLPTGVTSLQSMGASGVSVVLSEVRGLPHGRDGGGVLGREDNLCCCVIVRRRGRLLPRRAMRCTLSVARGLAGSHGEPRWRFDEELVFDDASLLSRRGDLQCCVMIRRRPSSLTRALVVASGLPVPTAGEACAVLVDSAGQVQGEVQLRIGWQSSAPLIAKVADHVQLNVQQGNWTQARLALEINGAEATEQVADAVDVDGRTALMWAARHERGTSFVRDLLALGSAGRFLADMQGATAVHYAALSGSLESLAAILGSSVPADMVAAGLGKLTPLMLAALRGSADHVRLLLGHGASACNIDSQGLPAAAWGFGGHSALLSAHGLQWVCEVGGPTVLETLTSDERTMSCLPQNFSEWQEERRELVSLLMEDLWRVAPPLEIRDNEAADAPTVSLRNLWLCVAERAAERAPRQFLIWLFEEDLLKRCESPQSYRNFLALLLNEALRQKSETLAVRLVTELGALGARSVIRNEGDAGALGACISSHCTLEAAVDAGMSRLAYALLCVVRSGPEDCETHIGQSSNAVRTLRLATEKGHAELTHAVLQRIPRELPRDIWVEPAVLGGSSQCECPVCFRSLCEQPVALYKSVLHFAATDPESVPACPHLVCLGCSERLGGKCPLCRTWFTEVRAVPDPMKDPMSWFHFTAGQAGVAVVPSTSIENNARTGASSSIVDSQQPAATLVSCFLPHVRSNASADPGAETSADQYSSAVALTSKRPLLTRADIECVLPATLPVDPQMLHQALDDGLWAEWDADADGCISQEDFFEPNHGLLRWLLSHIHELLLRAQNGEAPDLETDRGAWFWHARLASGSSSCSSSRSASGSFSIPAVPAGLGKGDVLRAILHLTGGSSLDRPQMAHLQQWINLHWTEWDPGGTGHVDIVDFERPESLADALIEKAALTRVRRAVQRLVASPAEAGKQVAELAQLCHCASGWSSAVADVNINAESSGLCLLTPRLTASGFAMRCARRGQAACGAEADEALYNEALPLVLGALDRHPGHTQVVGWACRVLVALLLSSSTTVADMSPKEASWTHILQAVLKGDAAAGLCSKVARSEKDKGQDLTKLTSSLLASAVSRIMNAMATLCSSPAASANARAIGHTVVAATAALRLLLVDEPSADPAAALPRLFLALPLEAATPAIRTLACLLACTMLCDIGGVVSQLDAWGYGIYPFWTPPRALAPASVRVGQQVEVCCHGGWLQGSITRAPEKDPTSPRDECWIVTCKNDTKVYSRHVWSPGWRKEAAAALQRLRFTLFAGTMSQRRVVPGAASLRQSLLNAVIVGGLGPHAQEPPPTPSGPVLKGATPSVTIHVGDKVWMSPNVETARRLQAQRHGDWSEPMIFCLDCPGRVVETLNGPARIRVSHGGLGTFCWNPAVVARSESCPEPLPFEEQHGPIVIGDEVLLCAEQEKAVPLQVGHGGWSTRMAFCLGRYTRIAALNNRGDVRTDTPGCGGFLWNPAAIEPVDGGSPLVLCAHAMARLDDEGAAVLLLPALRELAYSESSEEVDAETSNVVHEVLSALRRAGTQALEGKRAQTPRSSWASREATTTPFAAVASAHGMAGTVPKSLRAYGALALLALAIDLSGLCSKSIEKGSPPPHLPKVLLPEVASKKLLAELERCPAMHWPAADTGGVQFAEVVRGHVDAAAAASRWVLAFFATRHRRLLVPSSTVVE